MSLGFPAIRTDSPADRAGRVVSTLSQRTAGAPTAGPLVDTFARQAFDLRVSLTDKCNLRCTYCMPAEGMDWMPQSSLLTTSEVVRLVRIGVQQLGVRELRLTGGEPLIRRDLEEIIARICADFPKLPIAITTNGIGLDRRAEGLKKAGLTRINVSLDTVDEQTFKELTRRDRLSQVITGIDAAVAAGLTPVKLNAVLMRGINDHHAPDLVRFALERGLFLRFIEQMPLDGDHGWTREGMVTAAEVRDSLSAHWQLAPAREPRGSAPAELFTLTDKSTGAELGTVGIIASVTEPFCQACSRTRITAEGKVRSCLFSHEEFDLGALFRADYSDEQIAQAWRQAMWLKPKAHGMGHTGLGDEDYVQPERSMSAIGG